MTTNLSRPIARLSLLLSVLLLVSLIACQTIGPEEGTPAPTINAPSLVPQEVPITTLLRNPVSFEGETIWVTGQYQAIPLLVCGGETHRSPATWALVFGDVETFAAGFDEALRPLADTGLSLTVEGRWQKWEGPVGCGRRAPTQEIWYLAASRIVSPNPLVRSESGDEVVVVLPSPTSDTDVPETPVEPTPEASEEPPEPTEGPDPTRTPSPTFQSIPPTLEGATDTPSPTSTETTGDEATSTPTPSSTPTSAGGTAETGTPTLTATATATGGTAGPTAQPADQGTIAFDSVEKQTLAANSPHSWRFNPPAEEAIRITVGAARSLNISIELVAPDGTVLQKVNDGGPGVPETITYTTPNPTGQYRVVVSGESGTSGAYVLILFDSESVPVVVMRDTLIYGSGGAGNIPENTDHFWNFEGVAGDVISIDVSPSGTAGNLIFYIIGPDGDELEFIDETVGGGESLIDYTLPETGFYSIGIGEADFAPVGYTMTLTQ